MAELENNRRLVECRDAADRLSITLSDDARDFGGFSRLMTLRYGAPLNRIDGLDERFWDFLVEGRVVVLHSDTYMGVSLYAEDGQRDFDLREAASDLLQKSSLLMPEQSKFQFRMRDLLWAVSLIGVALALTVSFLRKVWAGDQVAQLAAVLLSAVGVLVGVGAGIGGLLSMWFAKIDREKCIRGGDGSLDGKRKRNLHPNQANHSVPEPSTSNRP